jgi:hypothetical protein
MPSHGRRCSQPLAAHERTFQNDFSTSIAD